MSNEPIFDQLADERGYKALLESIHRRPISNLFAKRVQARVVTQEGLAPDPSLDGPIHLIEKEPEVVVSPFVPVQGVPRGTASTVPLNLCMDKLMHRPEITEELDQYTYNPESTCTQRCEHESGIKGLLEHVGIDTSGGISVGDRVVAEPERLEENFHPMDLINSGVTFTEFMQGVIKQFHEKFPNAQNIRISTRSELDGTETFIVKGTREPVIQSHVQLPDSVVMGASREGLDGVLRDFRAEMGQQHPGFVPMAVTAIQEHEDGSATLTVEGQKITPVQPLSEKNAAQLME